MLLRYALLLLGLASVALTIAIPETDDEDYYDESDQVESAEVVKVYNGDYASLGMFPFMVAIHRLLERKRFLVCSGSIISDRWVLTAGHCVYGTPSKFLLVFGVVDKSGINYDHLTGDGVSMLSFRAIVHPDFAKGLNDIALVMTPRRIPFSDTVRPIRLAGVSYISEYEGELGEIFGWGQEFRGKPASDKLSYGHVKLLTNEECLDYWKINPEHVCTTAVDGENVCQGDSGSPLVVKDKKDEPVQVGIVSFGDGGCPSKRPIVYARVSSYMDWIYDMTEIDFETTTVATAS